jgi:hypothetical protein
MATVRLPRYSSPAYAAACIARIEAILERGPSEQDRIAAEREQAQREGRLALPLPAPKEGDSRAH